MGIVANATSVDKLLRSLPSMVRSGRASGSVYRSPPVIQKTRKNITSANSGVKDLPVGKIKPSVNTAKNPIVPKKKIGKPTEESAAYGQAAKDASSIVKIMRTGAQMLNEAFGHSDLIANYISAPEKDPELDKILYERKPYPYPFSMRRAIPYKNLGLMSIREQLAWGMPEAQNGKRLFSYCQYNTTPELLVRSQNNEAELREKGLKRPNEMLALLIKKVMNENIDDLRKKALSYYGAPEESLLAKMGENDIKELIGFIDIATDPEKLRAYGFDPDEKYELHKVRGYGNLLPNMARYWQEGATGWRQPFTPWESSVDKEVVTHKDGTKTQRPKRNPGYAIQTKGNWKWLLSSGHLYLPGYGKTLDRDDPKSNWENILQPHGMFDKNVLGLVSGLRQDIKRILPNCTPVQRQQYEDLLSKKSGTFLSKTNKLPSPLSQSFPDMTKSHGGMPAYTQELVDHGYLSSSPKEIPYGALSQVVNARTNTFRDLRNCAALVGQKYSVS